MEIILLFCFPIVVLIAGIVLAVIREGESRRAVLHRMAFWLGMAGGVQYVVVGTLGEFMGKVVGELGGKATMGFILWLTIGQIVAGAIGILGSSIAGRSVKAGIILMLSAAAYCIAPLFIIDADTVGKEKAAVFIILLGSIFPAGWLVIACLLRCIAKEIRPSSTAELPVNSFVPGHH